MGGHRGPYRDWSAELDDRDQLAHQVELLRAKAMNLERALENSRTIGAAIGIVMAMEKVTREHAFQLLRTASQQQNRKLHQVADDVVALGTLQPQAKIPA